MESRTLAVRLVAEIRAEMGRQRRTAAQMSADLHIPSSTLSRRLSGRTSLDLDELAAICEWLGVSVGELLDRGNAAPAGQSA